MIAAFKESPEGILIEEVNNWRGLRKFYSEEFFLKRVDLESLDDHQKKEILRDIKTQFRCRLEEMYELYNWMMNPIEVKVYPYLYGNRTVWAWSENGPAIRVGPGYGELVDIEDRQKVIDHFNRYQDVQFLFQ